jgi:threonine/homoserine/homoserine lactone efflux protein
VVAAITPGPSNVMLTAAGARVGVLRGIPCLLGVTTGMALMMFVVPLGLGTVVLAHPLLLTTLKWAGAAFLLWLSWKIATAPASANTESVDPVGYLEAAGFQWINPKSWLVTMSAAATFLTHPSEPALTHAAWLGSLFLIASAPACLLWLTFGATLHRILTTAPRRRLVNATLGLLLALSVVLVVR